MALFNKAAADTPRLPRNNLWRPAAFLLLLVAVLGVGAAGFFWKQAQRPVWSGHVFVGEILPVAELTTIKVQTGKLLKLDKTNWAGRKVVGVYQEAIVSVGFNLTDWKPQENVDLDERAKRVRVRVPAPVVLAVDPLPQTLETMTEHGIFRSSSLSAEEMKEIEILTRDLFLQAGAAASIQEQAKRQFEQVLARMAMPYGYTVTVEYR